MTKCCSKCKKEKDTDLFSEGHKWCIVCIDRQKEYRKTSKGKVTTWRYNRSQKGKRRRKTYESSDKGKENASRYASSEKGREAATRYRKRSPEKQRARALVQAAIDRGDIERPEVCSLEDETCKGAIQSHHPDYKNPLDVVFLCHKHHTQLHYGNSDLLLLDKLHGCIIDLESSEFTRAQADKLMECYRLLGELKGE